MSTRATVICKGAKPLSLPASHWYVLLTNRFDGSDSQEGRAHLAAAEVLLLSLLAAKGGHVQEQLRNRSAKRDTDP